MTTVKLSCSALERPGAPWRVHAFWACITTLQGSARALQWVGLGLWLAWSGMGCGHEAEAPGEAFPENAGLAHCIEGSQVSCDCDGDSVGIQTCEDGRAGFGPCDCAQDSATRFVLGGELSREFAATGLLQLPRGAICTAVLVDRDRILTAAHCLYDVNPADARFVVGADSHAPLASIPLLQVRVHPEYQPASDASAIRHGRDLAVAWLSSPITDIEPASLYLEDASIVDGHPMRITGYGAAGIDADGRAVGGNVRRSASVEISRLSEQGIHYSYAGMGSCAGDSGGPGFVRFADTYAVVGIASFGDHNCDDYGVYQRLDVATAFLAEAGLVKEPRAMLCDEDGHCDGQCEFDSDCSVLLCPGSSCTAEGGRCRPDGECEANCGSVDVDCAQSSHQPSACETYGLHNNGQCDPQCPRDPECSSTGTVYSDSGCPTNAGRPSSDGYCYHYNAAQVVCGRLPLQLLAYDGRTNLCMLFDAGGNQCGAALATTYFDPATGLCSYVAPNGLVCTQRWPTCDAQGCRC